MNWIIHAMVYYSAIRRNKLQIHKRTWMNLKITVMSERRH